jgi:hypothetical protein
MPMNSLRPHETKLVSTFPHVQIFLLFQFRLSYGPNSGKGDVTCRVLETAGRAGSLEIPKFSAAPTRL